MQPRTKRQKEILDYVAEFIESRGYSPSYQQIANHFRLASKAGVAKHIAGLERLGLLSRRLENGSFVLSVEDRNADPAATRRIEWFPESQRPDPDGQDDSAVEMPSGLIGNDRADRLRALLITDDSMTGDHICDGDIALFEDRSFARDGDIVAASVRGQGLIVRRFFRAGAEVELRSPTDGFPTLRLSADRVGIRGVFRALVRPPAR